MDKDQKKPKEASKIFENIIKASVKDNSKTETKQQQKKK